MSYSRALLLALGRTEELFYERAVQIRIHLDDPVFGYADDPAIVVGVWPVGDAGSATVPLHDRQGALDDDGMSSSSSPTGSLKSVPSDPLLNQ